MNTKQNICPICETCELKKILTIDSYTLLECGNCHLLHLSPITEEHGADYKTVLNLNIYISYMQNFHKKQYQTELSAIAKLMPSGQLLDVGCGAGWFLSEATKFGYNVTGLEPQPSLASLAKRENPKAEIIKGNFNKLKTSKKRFDVISFWSVFEHFADPIKEIKTASQLLNKGGILAIRTPNSQGLLQKLSLVLFKLSKGAIKLPLIIILQLEFRSKHWYLFSLPSLKMLLEKEGFDIRLVKQSTSMDWRDLDQWLAARKKKVGYLFRKIFLIAFATNALLTKLTQSQDDLVILASKK